jgi:hypothetical protein
MNEVHFNRLVVYVVFETNQIKEEGECLIERWGENLHTFYWRESNRARLCFDASLWFENSPFELVTSHYDAQGECGIHCLTGKAYFDRMDVYHAVSSLHGDLEVYQHSKLCAVRDGTIVEYSHELYV